MTLPAPRIHSPPSRFLPPSPAQSSPVHSNITSRRASHQMTLLPPLSYQTTLQLPPGVLLTLINLRTAASDTPVLHLLCPLTPSYGPTGYRPSPPMPTLLAAGGAPTGLLAMFIPVPAIPPLPALDPVPARPGISKSGLLLSIISRLIWLCCVCCWMRLGGGASPVLNAPPPSTGRQFGLTPRWETDVKLLVSDSAGERAPEWRFS